jgi:hypothetical protein
MIAALMLTACASGAPPMQIPTLDPQASDLALCPALPMPQSGAMTDLLDNHIAVAKAYHQCKDRHQGLVEWLEKTRGPTGIPFGHD